MTVWASNQISRCSNENQTKKHPCIPDYRHNSMTFSVQMHLTLQFSKSFRTAWGMRRRTVVLTSLRFRRGRPTAFPSRICPVTWSFPRTVRAARSWRPTRYLEDATRSVRCWRRPNSASCLRSPSGKKTCSCVGDGSEFTWIHVLSLASIRFSWRYTIRPSAFDCRLPAATLRTWAAAL